MEINTTGKIIEEHIIPAILIYSTHCLCLLKMRLLDPTINSLVLSKTPTLPFPIPCLLKRSLSRHLLTNAHHITSHHITSHHITSHHITQYHITSYHITSHNIISHTTIMLFYSPAPMHPAVNTNQLSLGRSHTMLVSASYTVVFTNWSVRT